MTHELTDLVGWLDCSSIELSGSINVWYNIGMECEHVYLTLLFTTTTENQTELPPKKKDVLWRKFVWLVW